MTARFQLLSDWTTHSLVLTRWALGCLVALSSISAYGQASAPTKLITDGFAHNDYEHARPLFDALDLGFCAVEADIFLTNGLILVGHDARDLKPERALTNLYLNPLAERVRKNKGRVHAGGPEFLLLIDIKTAAEPTYRALREILQSYRSMLTTFNGSRIQTNAIRVVLSGERPIGMVSNEVQRFVAIDGRVVDLPAKPPVALVPLISDNWTTLFRWKGEGEMPPAEKERLRSLIVQTHEQQKHLRLWAAPDMPAVWQLQRELGVDLINTDRLQPFAEASGPRN